MSLIWRKMLLMLYYYVHYLKSRYLTYDQKLTLMCGINNTVFILHNSFFNVQIHISQISTILTIIWAEHLKIYVTTCFQTRSWIVLLIFLLRTWLIYCSSSMWQFSTYFEYVKVLESTVSWFLSESNQLQTEYYFLPNNEPNLKSHLEKYSENWIE